MKAWRAILAGLLIAVSIVGTSLAQSKPPYEIVRSLQALHDQMALGSRAAQQAMPGLLRQLGARLAAEDPSVWRDPRNGRAIVVYILSGGEIRVARRVLESGRCAALEKRLIEGALAYLEANKVQAKNLLSGIDARSLEPAVGSHLALAQAALAAEASPAKAMSLLDTARILAPGTLVEDAALRREVFLADEINDFDKFIAMADQYLRRFRHSVYAENFRRSLAISIARLSQTANVKQLVALGGLSNEMTSQEQLRLYLRVAQFAILNGKIVAAKWAAEKAALLAPQNGSDAHRAALYDGAASVLMSDYDRGLDELKRLDSVHLPHDEALLKDAALGIATEIRRWPLPPPPPAGSAANKQAADSGEPETPPSPPKDAATSNLPKPLAATVESSDAALSQAQKLLADSDALLKDQVQ